MGLDLIAWTRLEAKRKSGIRVVLEETYNVLGRPNVGCEERMANFREIGFTFLPLQSMDGRLSVLSALRLVLSIQPV